MLGLLDSIKRALPPTIRQRGSAARERFAVARLTSLCMSREDLIADIRSAVANQRGYAAAKVGASQKFWMYYEIFLEKPHSRDELLDYQKDLAFHCLKQEGLFPESSEFYLDFNRSYMRAVANLDCLGICLQPAVQELEIIRHYGLTSKLIHYPLQEPDRSTPSRPERCYLPAFTGKRVLLVCPFAEFLRERANQETYEQVWSKIGKRWFHPSSVEAVEFPYGFARETHQRYATVLDLLKEIQSDISKHDFDVALIGAGGLSVPIASYIKHLGKVAIDLGGALQFMFGVSGKRWQDWDEYNKSFYNDHWTRLPAKYKPKETDVCDNGAYW